MTTVEKEQFWTQIVENPSLWGTIQTSDKSFNTQAENIWTVMNQTFIKDGGIKEVNRWEIMLGEILDGSGEGTLNERKARILKRITEHPLITKGTLKESLEKLVSEKFGYIFESAYDKYTDTFDFKIACQEIDKEDINNLISNTIPKVKNVNLEYEDLRKYDLCVSIDDIKAINADYMNDLTFDGEWIYPLSNFNHTSSRNDLFYNNKNLKHIDCAMPKLTNISYCFVGSGLKTAKLIFDKITDEISFYTCGDLEEVEIEVKNCSRFTFCGCKNLKKAVFDSAKQVHGNDSFSLTYTKGDGIPMSYPNLQSGSGMFSNCSLKAKHVIIFLNSIPSWNNDTTHNLTVGIHIDHQTDEDVLTAISNAETKGWTMTVQWNGTPTASTATSYSLRKPMIYAKIINTQSPEEYFKQKLDWGHYVTNWEENGYQEFSSLEEAYEYFGIEPEL